MTTFDNPTPLQRLGLWMLTNALLPDNATHQDVTELVDTLGDSSVGAAVRDVIYDAEVTSAADPATDHGITAPSPMEGLGIWLVTNTGLPDGISHADADAIVDALGNSSVPDAVASAANAS